MIILLLIIIVLAIALVLNSNGTNSATQHKTATQDKKVKRNPDFHPDIFLSGFANKYKFLVDKKKKLVFFTQSGSEILIPFQNIINAELSQDGNNISKKASYIKVFIRLRNMNKTHLDVDCYHTPFSMQITTTGMTGMEYRESLEKAQELINVINYIMDDNVNTQNTASKIQNQTNNISIADEIEKLSKLKNEGIITQEEFENQKQKLLAQ